MSIETKVFGGNGGSPFDIEAVKSLGFSSTDIGLLNGGGGVYALLLNGNRHGGTGGLEGTTLEFHPDEYIDRIKILAQQTIQGIQIRTNRGRTLVTAGRIVEQFLGLGGGELSNIRVLGLGGNSGGALDKLRVRYIPNYTESSLVEDNQTAIIDIYAPGESFERSESWEVSQLSASTRVMETVFSLDIGGESSALGNFIAKLTASTGLKRTSKTEIKEEVKTIEQFTQKETFETPLNSVGLEMVLVDVFREEDGFMWLIPVSESQLITVPLGSGLDSSTGVYDLTGLVAVQLPSMANRLEKRNGYNYFRATPTIVSGLVAVPFPSMGNRLKNYNIYKRLQALTA